MPRGKKELKGGVGFGTALGVTSYGANIAASAASPSESAGVNTLLAIVDPLGIGALSRLLSGLGPDPFAPKPRTPLTPEQWAAFYERTRPAFEAQQRLRLANEMRMAEEAKRRGYGAYATGRQRQDAMINRLVERTVALANRSPPMPSSRSPESLATSQRLTSLRGQLATQTAAIQQRNAVIEQERQQLLQQLQAQQQQLAQARTLPRVVQATRRR